MSLILAQAKDNNLKNSAIELCTARTRLTEDHLSKNQDLYQRDNFYSAGIHANFKKKRPLEAYTENV